MNVALRWEGPFEFLGKNGRSLLLAPAGAHAGIYVWGARTERGLLPHYVGETKDSFGKRHLQHFQAYVSGVYSTRDADAFVAGREQMLHRGPLWRSNTLPAFQQFIDNFPFFASHLYRTLQSIEIYVAPLEVVQRTRRLVEGGLVRVFREAPHDIRALFPDLRVWSRLPNDEVLAVECVNPPPILGFPSRFEA